MLNSCASKLLVVAPHSDDGHLGCGGTIARFVRNGWRASYVALSLCQESLPAGASADLKSEVEEACGPIATATCFDFPVRHFPEHRQAILDCLIRLRQELQPEVIFCSSWHALHQDHQVTWEESLRAFKGLTVWGYDLPWDTIQFTAAGFVRLTEPDMAEKERALMCYRSQTHRPYMNGGLMRALAMTRGLQCGAPLAEAFEAMRTIL